MSEATPRPWTREVVRTSIGVCHKIGPFCPSKVTGKENYACIYDDCYSDVPRNEELLANAKLIVRAVNSHDALLAACKFAHVRALQTNDVDDELVSKLSAAIAAAEASE